MILLVMLLITSNDCFFYGDFVPIQNIWVENPKLKSFEKDELSLYIKLADIQTICQAFINFDNNNKKLWKEILHVWPEMSDWKINCHYMYLWIFSLILLLFKSPPSCKSCIFDGKRNGLSDKLTCVFGLWSIFSTNQHIVNTN